jgi:hypothetical protein
MELRSPTISSAPHSAVRIPPSAFPHYVPGVGVGVVGGWGVAVGTGVALGVGVAVGLLLGLGDADGEAFGRR